MPPTTTTLTRADLEAIKELLDPRLDRIEKGVKANNDLIRAFNKEMAQVKKGLRLAGEGLMLAGNGSAHEPQS